MREDILVFGAHTAAASEFLLDDQLLQVSCDQKGAITVLLKPTSERLILGCPFPATLPPIVGCEYERTSDALVFLLFNTTHGLKILMMERHLNRESPYVHVEWR